MRRTLTVAFLCVAFPSYVSACMFSVHANPIYWSEQATSIVDATVYGFEQRPLANTGGRKRGAKNLDSWVLKLQVHRTLRGKELSSREVATRFLSTTSVDEAYVAALVGLRSEFAILDAPYSNPSHISKSLPDFDFPLQNDVHVFDRNGEAIDEIWELPCMRLPIFKSGTFAD